MKPIRLKERFPAVEYSYKGYFIARYKNARNGTRYCVESGASVELAADFTKLGNAANYIDSHL